MMSALNLFGVGTAVLGAAGTSVTLQASRQVLAIPRVGHEPADWPVLSMLCFIFLVDLAVVAVGAGVALLPM